jgi:DNA polymerase-3 subunit delta'
MFNNWEEIRLYQDTVYQVLVNSFEKNRIAHSYIFEGVKGTRKQSVAILFAKTLLCTNRQGVNPCNECHNCKRVENLTHPNLFLINPQGRVIKKEVVSNLIQEFSKASIEKGPRIYIVVDADRFNQSSANTLLKTMEEPGQEIYQILITENFNNLLGTIISRAETLHFKPTSRKLIKEYLMSLEIEETLANLVSQYTADQDTAESLIKNKVIEDIYVLVTEIFSSLLDKNRSAIISLFQENKLLSDNEKTEIFLNLLTYYQKDILAIKSNLVDNIIYTNQIETIERLAKKVSFNQAQEYLEEMLELANKLKYNINTHLAFNKLLMNLERGYKHATQSRSDTI